MKISSKTGRRAEVPARVVARLFAAIDVDQESDCWHLRVSRNNAGYPQLCWVEGGRQYNIGGHVLMARLAERGGRGLGEAEQVHHDCEVPTCGNPKHLRIVVSSKEHRRLHMVKRAAQRQAKRTSR